jgi:DNA polymerase
MAAANILILDFETRSRASLKHVGAFEYAADPSTEILCASFIYAPLDQLAAAGITTLRSWDSDMEKTEDLLRAALQDSSTMVVAHNAFFEWAICRHRLGVDIPESRITCTASLAAALALPRSLEGVGAVLGLDVQKDKTGHRLMLKLSKPRRPTAASSAPWHEDPGELARLAQYCETDVKVTRDLFLKLPPLSARERKVWELDQKINRKGFAVDRPLVQAVQKMIAEESQTLTNKMVMLTGGEIQSPRQTARLMRWLGGNMKNPPSNLQSKTVAAALGAALEPLAREALELRQLSSKTSIAKYDAFEMHSRWDGRCRESLLYSGAGTGRWTGLGVQPQNLPRPTLNNTDLAAAICTTGDLEVVRMFYDKPLEVFSSVLRSVIIPTERLNFYCADYAAIETRVVFWLAGHREGLKAFDTGEDLYRSMASAIYGINIAAVTSEQRQLGKAAILGCGFQMGAPKFYATCKNWGLDVSEALALAAVETYRAQHKPVVGFWREVENAALTAVTYPGKTVGAGLVEFCRKGRALLCRLPSGRRLTYMDPTVKVEAREFNGCASKPKPRLAYSCVNGITRKWEETDTYGGALVENITQAVARDLMAEAMLAIDAVGFDIVLSVHDEILVEHRGEKRYSEFLKIMSSPPQWAAGLPVKVSGWVGRRYRK